MMHEIRVFTFRSQTAEMCWEQIHIGQRLELLKFLRLGSMSAESQGAPEEQQGLEMKKEGEKKKVLFPWAFHAEKLLS